MKRRNKRKQTKKPRNKPRNRRVVAPVAYSNVMTNRGPNLRKLNIKHKEYVADLKVTGAPTRYTFRINPGLAEMFPWLSTIANRFESYHFRSLKFHYIPSVSTTTEGAVAFIPDYDPGDDDSSLTKTELLTFEDCVRAPGWTSFTVNCKQRNLSKRKTYFTRNQNVPIAQDIKFYDVGQLLVYSTVEKPSGVNFGELWVEYDVDLETPQLEQGQAGNADDYVAFHPSTVGEFENMAEIISEGETAGSEAGTLDLEDAQPGLFAINKPGYYLMDVDGVRDTVGALPFNYSVPAAFTNAAIKVMHIFDEEWVNGDYSLEALIDASTASEVNPAKFTWNGPPIRDFNNTVMEVADVLTTLTKITPQVYELMNNLFITKQKKNIKHFNLDNGRVMRMKDYIKAAKQFGVDSLRKKFEGVNPKHK